MQKDLLSRALTLILGLGLISCAAIMPAQAEPKCDCWRQTDGSTYCLCVDDEGKTYCESCKVGICTRVKCH